MSADETSDINDTKRGTVGDETTGIHAPAIVTVPPADWLDIPDWNQPSSVLAEAKAIRAWVMLGASVQIFAVGIQLFAIMTNKVRI